MSLNWRDWPVPHHSSASVLEELAERFEFHDDDVLINTYPKCGTTLTQEMVSCLLLGADATRGTSLMVRSPFIDLCPPPGRPRPMDEARGLARPRVLKTHLPPAYHVRHLNRDPTSGKGPLNVIVMRNPKDAMVSTYYHMTGGMRPLPPGVSDSFAQFWRDFLLRAPASDQRSAAEMDKRIKVHDFFEFSLSWWSLRAHPRVLILFYEDILRDKPGEVRRLADFLGVRLTEELLRDVLEVTSFPAMRGNPNVNISLTDPAHWRPGTSFIRKGEVGDWMNHFTVADSQLADSLIAGRLAGTELTFQYE